MTNNSPTTNLRPYDLEVIPSDDLTTFKLASLRPQNIRTFYREYFLCLLDPK